MKSNNMNSCESDLVDKENVLENPNSIMNVYYKEALHSTADYFCAKHCSYWLYFKIKLRMDNQFFTLKLIIIQTPECDLNRSSIIYEN